MCLRCVRQEEKATGTKQVLYTIETELVRVCPYSDYCVCFFTLFFSFFFFLSSSSLKKREKSGLQETVGIPLVINWKVLRGWGGVVFCCKIITERKENHVLIIVYIQ